MKGFVPGQPKIKCDDISGRRFGRLTVVRAAGHATTPGGVQILVWECVCDCGKTILSRTGSLNSGKQLSCGCLGREHRIASLRTHGATERGSTNRAEFWVWQGMRNRCYRKTHRHYYMYGGAGITVCDRWRESFASFFEDMGPRPSKKHSLDRYPNQNGNYEPGNVRWATWPEQQRNKSSNHWITCNGETLIITDWAKRLGCRDGVIHGRLKLGWTPERAVSQPVQKARRRSA
jgi:hypothetical protein